MDRAEFMLSRPVCLSLPVEEVDKLLREKDGRCALVYLALLRAGGAQIDATPRGYQLHPAEKGYTGILACVHCTQEEMRRELYTVVDQGGIVVDVAVENSLYGELRGNLNLASRYDVDNFIQQAKDTPEALLSRMTGGVHLHTLHCPDAGSFERIKKELEEKGILYRKE